MFISDCTVFASQDHSGLGIRTARSGPGEEHSSKPARTFWLMGAQLEGLCSGRWGQNPSEQASVLTPSPLSPRPGKLEAQQQSLDVFGRSGREEI